MEEIQLRSAKCGKEKNDACNHAKLSRRRFLRMGGLLITLPWRPFPYDHTQKMDLFVDEENLESIRDRYLNSEVFAEYRTTLEAFDFNAAARFIQEEVRYNDQLFHLRRLTDMATERAFHYVMTGYQASAQMALVAVNAIMKFERWDYFLDGDRPIGFQRASRATTAVSLCLDWLNDHLDDTQKTQWIHAMAERGCKPCFRALWGMRYPEQIDGWAIDPASTYFEHRPGDRDWDLSQWPYIFDKNNLKAEPAAALTIGAIAYEHIMGPNSDTERWLEQSIYSISGYRSIFEQDGSYNEGISYAGATALHLMQAYSILHRFRNTDLSDQLNWPGFMDFALGMSLPTATDPTSVVNFGDVGRGLSSAVPYWIAAHTKDPYASWFATHRAASHDVWSVLWAPSSNRIPSRPPPQQPTLWCSNLEWIVSRTGYEPSDLVVAMRSGPPFNHEHADRNSLILACHGEQLIADPHRPGYSRTDPTWMMRGTAGHSGILIDGQGHQYVDGSEGTNASEAIARLVRFGEREDYHYWSSDATQAYQLVMPDVHLVMRTVIVLYEQPAVFLIDKIVKTNTPSTIQARFFAYNNDQQGRVETYRNGLYIVRPHAALHISSYSPQRTQSTSALLPIKEDIAQKYPFGDITTASPATDILLITGLFPIQNGSASPSVEIKEVEDTRYEVRVNSRKRLLIEDRGAIPEIEIA